MGGLWTPEAITEMQRRIPPLPAVLRTRADYRRCARWWELEARRGYPSSGDSLKYSQNMSWAAEVVRAHGPGTWLELKARTAKEAGE